MAQGGQAGGSPAPPSALGCLVSVPDLDFGRWVSQLVSVPDFDFGGGVVTEGGGVGIRALLKVGEGEDDLMSMKGTTWEFRRSFL